MPSSNEPWSRARELGDAARKLLAAANVGGIGIVLVLAGRLAAHAVSPWWAMLIVGVFSLGLMFAVGGYLHSQHRVRKHGEETGGFWWNAAALVCLVLGALGGVYVQMGNPQAPPADEAGQTVGTPPATGNQRPRYAAIVDAGSSGSRLWIFEWQQHGSDDPVVTKLEYLKGKTTQNLECPLTDMIAHEQQTCDCLTNLLTQGYQKVAAAAGSAPAAMPLWVKATGGVRKERMERQVDILTKTEKCLKTSATNYSLQSVEAIAGQNEALYAWLAINYARKTLRADSVGIVEIGGQSAQFAFKVEKPIAATQRGTVLTVPLKSGNLYVYAHSDALGKEAGIAGLGSDDDERARVRARDCGLASKVDDCLKKIDHFLCNARYQKEPCPHRSPEFPPGDTQFIGLSNFMHIMSNIKLDQPSFAAVQERARKMCGPEPGKDKLREDWITADRDFRKDVCMDALYTTQVAQYAWGIPLTAITPAKKTDPEWPLGAMFMEVAQHAKSPSL